ncbi:MAG: hypothetical protein NTY02_01890 [Acidobacteria bacterium]|nr:hypothetical protein [Acidobacteriota bacterium]
MRRHAFVLLSVVIWGTLQLPASMRVEILQSVGGLPPEIVGSYREPAAFQQVRSGQYFVFDRRGHAVFGVDVNQTTTWKLVEIGEEAGRLLDPSAFDAEPGGSFVVADAPGNRERIQVFSGTGRRLGGFSLPGRAVARVTMGSVVLSGIGSLQYTGAAIIMSQPETGSLITEYGLAGSATRSIGILRPTGHEQDADLHLALNSGLPLVNPKGGFYFVFQTGVPVFRKYDQAGRLLYERHIEGVELDPVLAALPTVWPRRTGQAGERELPLVTPAVRTAAVDAGGNLWVVLTLPYTYVYDGDGNKVRVVQFRGAGIISPSSLFFAGAGRAIVTPGCFEFKL